MQARVLVAECLGRRRSSPAPPERTRRNASRVRALSERAVRARAVAILRELAAEGRLTAPARKLLASQERYLAEIERALAAR